MIHTWLTVFWAVDRVTFAELDLVQSAQFVHLPPYEGVVIGIGVCSDE